jgi:hypothetical protein
VARYPGAQWRPISVNYQSGGNTPRFLILHVMQGTLAGTDSWFRNGAAQVSAHFGVGKDGTVIQWVSTSDIAWHAADANGYSIGVEHEGYAGESLTAEQFAADAKLLAWAHEHHPIPLQVTSDPVNGAGLAWHGLGGYAWGDHPDCPGEPIVDARAALVTAAHNIINPPKPKPDPEPAAWKDDPMLLDTVGVTVPLSIPSGAKHLVLTPLESGSVTVQLLDHGTQAFVLAKQPHGGTVVAVPSGVQHGWLTLTADGPVSVAVE